MVPLPTVPPLKHLAINDGPIHGRGQPRLVSPFAKIGWEFLVPQVEQSQSQGEYSLGARDTLAVQRMAGHSAKVRAPPRPRPLRTTPHLASSALPIWLPSALLPLFPVHPSLQPHWAMGTVSSASHEVSWPSLLQEIIFPPWPSCPNPSFPVGSGQSC